MLNLEDNGSNIHPFVHLFLDKSGVAFQDAIVRSFSFASETVHTVKKLPVGHPLELWDQATSYKLDGIIKSKSLLADGVEILLEKLNSEEVWHYGFSVLKTDRDRKTRQWVLPDGLIKTTHKPIAIEFDHGLEVGKWANQLLKAIRGLASDKIDGIIYCFCFDSESSVRRLSDGELTDEFQKLVDLHKFNKPIGIVTVFPNQLQSDQINSKEIIDFLDMAYLQNPKKSKESHMKAEQIIKALGKIT